MDNAVALVQAYLRINGYFTVTEFPVVESGRSGLHRTATDIDILAVRFRDAARLVPRHGRAATRDVAFADIDPASCCAGQRALPARAQEASRRHNADFHTSYQQPWGPCRRSFPTPQLVASSGGIDAVSWEPHG